MRQEQLRRVLLIEPQELFLPHLVEALESDGLNIVGTVRAIDETQLAKLKPEVILADIGISDAAGFATLGRVRKAAPNARLIVFAGMPNPAWHANAWAQGVDQILTNNDGIPELLAAVRMISPQ
jgi:DNA-binding NarL/FixJ family response regulator